MSPPLDQLLTVAVEAAHLAGAVLREEFHRPGGPRSDHGNHAAVDAEAEILIRDHLLAATPDFGYLGEELGVQGMSPQSGRPLWIVDPNDGTSDYLKGYRGAAVSIALLLDGEAVLGVIYAPNAPDDDGDLFCALKGEVTTRNGVALEVLSAGVPGPESVVLCTVDGERNPARATEVFAPCRFRSVASVAYRLALMAAGEGDFALSLSGTNYWDFAAAHAVVLGVGGDVFDEELRPVRYPVDGRGRCGKALFAGHPDFVAAYARRELRSSLSAGPDRRPRIVHVREAALLRRAQGCLLGQLAGDALGSQVEFQQKPERQTELLGGGPFQCQAGQPTDDSEMALALARALLEKGRYDPEAVFAAYRRWYATNPPDIGGTTRGALTGTLNPESQANGSLMRLATLGIFAAGRAPDQAGNWAAQDAALTHPHPVCIACAAIYGDALAFAIQEGASPFEVFRRALNTAAALGVPPQVFEALQRAEYEPPQDYHTSMGWALVAFQNAFYRLLAHRSAEEAIIETVVQGGDTDTNGAICGALCGAVHGRDAIPIRWQRLLLTCRDPRRPEWLWATDALILAEQLLGAGA